MCMCVCALFTRCRFVGGRGERCCCCLSGFLDSIGASARTPRGTHVQTQTRNRNDSHQPCIELLAVQVPHPDGTNAGNYISDRPSSKVRLRGLRRGGPCCTGGVCILVVLSPPHVRCSPMAVHRTSGALPPTGIELAAINPTIGRLFARCPKLQSSTTHAVSLYCTT